MNARHMLTLGVTLLAGLLGAGSARANHQLVASTAHRLEQEAIGFARDADRVFAHSRLTSDIVGAACVVSDRTAELEARARTRCGCADLRRELRGIEQGMFDLIGVIEQAELRVLRGWDPPLCGNVDALQARLERMDRALVDLADQIDRLDRAVVIGRPPVNVIDPYGPGFGSGGIHHGSSFPVGPSIGFGVGSTTLRISLGGNQNFGRPNPTCDPPRPIGSVGHGHGHGHDPHRVAPPSGRGAPEPRRIGSGRRSVESIYFPDRNGNGGNGGNRGGNHGGPGNGNGGGRGGNGNGGRGR